MPCPDDPSLPIYALGNGQYVIDDSQPSFRFATTSFAASTADTPPEPPGGGGGTNAPDPWLPDSARNYAKFAALGFLIIQTNDAASNDTNLYNFLLTFGDDTGTNAFLQIKKYGNNAVVIKANHFDYSAETDRDFALLVCDSPEKPTWKNIDLAGTSDAQDGWLVLGLVPRFEVTDPMFLFVANITSVRSAVFRAVPYSGPQIILSGANDYDTVSNTITLAAAISDLSGTTNQQLQVLVNGLTARYTNGPSNTINLDTRYAPNGVENVAVTVMNTDALVHNPTNPPMDAKLEYDNTANLALDFENATYVYFSGDNSDPDILTNYMIFGVSPPKYISATITDRASGRVLRTFSGYDPSFNLVQLDWNFAEADGVTPFTNDNYNVTFQTSDTPSGPKTTLTASNKVERAGVRPANWVISSIEELDPFHVENGPWINGNMTTWWNAIENMYESLYSYDFASQSQYYSWQIGLARDNPGSPTMPIRLNPSTDGWLGGWRDQIHAIVTNRNYSDFNYMGHGNAYLIGGGEYDPAYFWWFNYCNSTIQASDMMNWVQAGATANRRYKMRKVAMWSCYSARLSQAAYSTWHTAFGIFDGERTSWSGKNVGLFFNDKVEVGYYGNPPGTIAEVAAEFDKLWVMGANPFPGGADPNYSFDFAFRVTKGIFPELSNATPVIIGCELLPYAGVYDDELMINDFHQVHP